VHWKPYDVACHPTLVPMMWTVEQRRSIVAVHWELRALVAEHTRVCGSVAAASRLAIYVDERHADQEQEQPGRGHD